MDRDIEDANMKEVIRKIQTVNLHSSSPLPKKYCLRSQVSSTKSTTITNPVDYDLDKSGSQHADHYSVVRESTCLSDPAVLFDLSAFKINSDSEQDDDNCNSIDEFDLNKTFSSKTLSHNELSLMLSALDDDPVEDKMNNQTSNNEKCVSNVHAVSAQSITCL